MKLILLPLRLLLIITLTLINIVLCIITIPIALIAGLIKRSIIDELNDWYEVYIYIFKWIYEYLII